MAAPIPLQRPMSEEDERNFNRAKMGNSLRRTCQTHGFSAALADAQAESATLSGCRPPWPSTWATCLARPSAAAAFRHPPSTQPSKWSFRQLWSMPNDIVFSPFAGIGSELYVAVQQGRRALGVELKDTYYDQAVANLQEVERSIGRRTLFDEDAA